MKAHPLLTVVVVVVVVVAVVRSSWLYKSGGGYDVISKCRVAQII